jgi:AraC family transcriptional regulator of adaptative response / DNA-3-methyladenine glycosylase II
VIELKLTPPRPYRLADAVGGRDPTRRSGGGVLEVALRTEAGPARARVWQRIDGTLGVRLAAPDPATALDRLRFVLSVDVDHSRFLAQARADRLLAPLVRRRPALRPARRATVAHALVRALAGQLITSVEAARIERRLLAAICPAEAGLRLPPTWADLRRLSPAVAARCGLSPGRAATLVRIARTVDPARLATAPTAAATRRLIAEPGVGPWAAGVVLGEGLGRTDAAPVGDLGLVKLCSALLARRADAADTARLLAPYGEWAAFAAAHLLAHPLARGQRFRGYLAA